MITTTMAPEILLKVAINTITLTLTPYSYSLKEGMLGPIKLA
jgi:hypothetical protein